jgi:enamine deaminase RidA (YjgF/YER057c/UK114 family)
LEVVVGKQHRAKSRSPEVIGFEGEAPVPISLARRAGDFVFVSGISDHYFKPADVVFDGRGEPIDDGGGAQHRSIEQQTRGTLEELARILAGAGCTLDDVVDVVVWLKEPRDFAGFNTVYQDFFVHNRPTRAVLRNAMMFVTRIELKATAYKPLGRRAGSTGKAAARR